MKDGKPAYAFAVLREIGAKQNIEFAFSKDGSLYTPDSLAHFDAFFFLHDWRPHAGQEQSGAGRRKRADDRSRQGGVSPDDCRRQGLYRHAQRGRAISPAGQLGARPGPKLG